MKEKESEQGELSYSHLKARGTFCQKDHPASGAKLVRHQRFSFVYALARSHVDSQGTSFRISPRLISLRSSSLHFFFLLLYSYTFFLLLFRVLFNERCEIVGFSSASFSDWIIFEIPVRINSRSHDNIEPWACVYDFNDSVKLISSINHYLFSMESSHCSRVKTFKWNSKNID